MSDITTITCPKCGEKIPLSDALTHDMKEQLAKEMGVEIRKKETELKAREEKMQEHDDAMWKEYEKKMESERVTLKQEAEKKAREEAGVEFQDLVLANAEKDQKLQEAGQREMDFIKQKRELEEKVKSVDLEVARKIEAERKKIEEGAETKVSEEFRLQLRARDEKETQMGRTIDDLKRKLEQGSMQIQGEVQEDDLKEALGTTFPEDTIVDVPKGVNGADLIQIVQTRTGFKAGTMIWESKNTKSWSGDWIKKLKDDQVIAKADMAILVSQVLPEEIKGYGFGLVDGAWVSNPAHYLSLAHVLRHQLIQLAHMKTSLVGKDEKMAILYEYLTSPQFQNRMENIVNAFVSMQSDLLSEQRAIKKHWRKREKEIERVIDNTTGMYGDLQGYIGTALPTIASLELPSGESEEGEEISDESEFEEDKS